MDSHWEWGRRRDNYLIERKRTLKRIYAEELENDLNLLARDWTEGEDWLSDPQAGGRYFIKLSLFESKHMYGSPGYILEDISRYVNKYVENEELMKALNIEDDDAWRTEELKGWGDDIVDTTKESGLAFVNKLIKRPEFVKDYSDPAQVDVIRRAFNLMKMLRVLRRHADLRNYTIDHVPGPSGESISREFLRSSWILHRAWIRALHYRSLNVGDEPFGGGQLHQIMHLSLGFLAMELGLLHGAPWSPRYSHRDPEGYDITELHDGLKSSLKALDLAFRRDNQSPISGETRSSADILHYNVSPEVISQLIQKIIWGLLGNYWELLEDLLSRNAKLESLLDVEHVEDCLINSRVVVDDEQYLLHNLLGYWNYQPSDAYGMPIHTNHPLHRNIRDILRKTAQINRLRRSYLLLRDWTYKRPWRKLYYVYDTGENGRDKAFFDHIKSFYDHIEELKSPGPQPDHLNPTDPAHVYSCLFPIHPIASSHPHLKYYEDPCTICYMNFEPQSTIAQLHCSHLFHFLCIRDALDQPDKIVFRCPTCRSSDWTLRGVAGVVAETHDVWDYEEVLDDDPFYQTHRMDIDNMYHERENTQRILAQDFTRNWGYGHGDEDDRPHHRDIDTEMSTVRYARRLHDKFKRDIIRTEKSGIHTIDPDDPAHPRPEHYLTSHLVDRDGADYGMDVDEDE